MKPEEKNERPEFKGKNLEDAVSHAEHVLKLQRNQLNYEIVTEKTKLFGIKGREIVIRAWPKEAPEESAVTKFLNALLPVFPLEIGFQVKQKSDHLYVIFNGNDKQLLLWKDGALLLALQHVLNKISDQKVQVDCEFFRKRKEKKLKDLAQDVGRAVRDTGREEVLDLMNPYERRIIHMTINQFPDLASESLGDGFLKKVKVFVVKGSQRPTSRS
ncbi:MAG: Jag N-terminal domain-containing protein [Candidatus Aminicenantes bacterium]|nr:Jag N-terminal domain-containing protein [Candidatus Aminicenantes bacterium]